MARTLKGNKKANTRLRIAATTLFWILPFFVGGCDKSDSSDNGQGGTNQSDQAGRNPAPHVPQKVGPPKTSQDWVEYGENFFDSNIKQEALDAFNKATELDPENARAWVDKGRALDELGRGKEALTAFDEALKRTPYDRDALYLKGITLKAFGRDEEALEPFNKLMFVIGDGRDALNAKVLVTKGELLLRLGRYREASDDFENAIDAVYKTNSFGTFELGTQTREEAAATRDDGDSAIIGMCMAYDHLGEANNAIVLIDELLTSDPNDVAAMAAKGDALSSLGRYADAYDIFEKALKVLPTDNAIISAIRVHEGESFLSAGKFSDALSAFEASVKLDPKSAPALSGMGLALLRLQRHQDALNAFDQALAINPTDVTAWEATGALLLRFKRNEEALRAFDAALEMHPTDATAWEGKGDALSNLGKTREADECYGKSKSLGGPQPTTQPTSG